MDAPPAHEDCRPFVHVAQLLADAGVNAPRVLAADVERGYLLLTDLGDTTFASALDAQSAPTLYSDAIDALIRWQARVARSGAARVRRRAAAARARAVSGLVRRAPSRRRAHRCAARRTRPRVRNGAREQPRAAARLRPPRLSFAQPDGDAHPIRACSISRTRFTGRSRTTSCRCCAMPTSNGTRSGSSTGRCAIGSARATAGLPVDADFGDVLARLRVDGRAAAAQGARHLRATAHPRRQGRLRDRHAARAALSAARRGALPRARPAARAAR